MLLGGGGCPGKLNFSKKGPGFFLLFIPGVPFRGSTRGAVVGGGRNFLFFFLQIGGARFFLFKFRGGGGGGKKKIRVFFFFFPVGFSGPVTCVFFPRNYGAHRGKTPAIRLAFPPPTEVGVFPRRGFLGPPGPKTNFSGGEKRVGGKGLFCRPPPGGETPACLGRNSPEKARPPKSGKNFFPRGEKTRETSGPVEGPPNGGAEGGYFFLFFSAPRGGKG